MTRHLLNFLALLSLLLCLAAVGLWVLSYRIHFDYRRKQDIGFDGRIDRSDLHELAIFCGGLQAAVIRNHYTPAWTWGDGWYVTRFDEMGRFAPNASSQLLFSAAKEHHELFGFRYYSGRMSPETPCRSVRVPLWFLAGCFAAGPAVWVVGRVGRSRRARPGLCAWCGYDLRETPGRCPECGMVPTAAATS